MSLPVHQHDALLLLLLLPSGVLYSRWTDHTIPSSTFHSSHVHVHVNAAAASPFPISFLSLGHEHFPRGLLSFSSLPTLLTPCVDFARPARGEATGWWHVHTHKRAIRETDRQSACNSAFVGRGGWDKFRDGGLGVDGRVYRDRERCVYVCMYVCVYIRVYTKNTEKKIQKICYDT